MSHRRVRKFLPGLHRYVPTILPYSLILVVIGAPYEVIRTKAEVLRNSNQLRGNLHLEASIIGFTRSLRRCKLWLSLRSAGYRIPGTSLKRERSAPLREASKRALRNASSTTEHCLLANRAYNFARCMEGREDKLYTAVRSTMVLLINLHQAMARNETFPAIVSEHIAGESTRNASNIEARKPISRMQYSVQSVIRKEHRVRKHGAIVARV